MGSDQVGVKIEPAEAESLSMSGSSGILTPVSPYGCVKPISPEQEELIHRLVYFQNEYEQPSEEDLKRITRPNLMESRKVEKIQEIYLEALKAYVDNRRRPKSGIIFAKLLSVLTELRTLGNQNNEMCYSLKFKNKKLPVFLAEIWDVGT
ncbi:ecdysone receptor isoform X3 [Vespula maculifrons]|uniref:Ecdysone receptor isoform X3 n=1 Tax=Vespula maculifrons TaxID=7453 RepID=A0ABD2CC23_VESMC